MRDKIQPFLDEVVGGCPWCEKPVTRSMPRGLDFEDRISHLACLDSGSEGPCFICGAPITRRERRELDGRRGLRHESCTPSRRS